MTTDHDFWLSTGGCPFEEEDPNSEELETEKESAEDVDELEDWSPV